MTREEQIIQASEIFSTNDLLSFGGACEELDYGFREGAKWADKNPINVWHDASEEPNMKDKYIHIMYLDKYGSIRLKLLCEILEYYGGEISWNESVKKSEITLWAYATDLLPKGCKK